MTDDYYEDSHGNKIIGSHNKSKFVFSGFNSFVRIGENVNLHNSSFYIHNDVEIEIGDRCIINNCEWNVTSTRIEIRNGCTINNDKWNVTSTHIEIGNKCSIDDNSWALKSQSYVKLGDGGVCREGVIGCDDYGQIIIGRNFSIETRYWLSAPKYAQIIVGDDVMCSHNVILLGNDGHSIFDVHTGMNINSTEEISKKRKIIIGNHVWLGVNAIILFKSEICDGSIIGAGSLVKGKIPNNCIAAGIPAQVIKKILHGAEKIVQTS